MHMTVFGAGYSGKAIADLYRQAGHTVSGTTRSTEKFGDLQALGIEALHFDGTGIGAQLRQATAKTTHLLQSIAPGRDGDALLRLAGDDLLSLMPDLQWIGYLSTVGVYGDHQGGWVTEETPCKPVSARSVERVEAETSWLALGEQTGVPVAILRLSGIYGPGRNAFANLAGGTARRLIKPNQVFNRIRVEDIAGATVFLADRLLGGVYNVTDSEPCAPQDVVTEAARLMGVEPPPEQAFETAELSPMARSFYGENKRVSNALLKELGFTFLYPDYRTSLQQLWSADTWRKETVDPT